MTRFLHFLRFGFINFLRASLTSPTHKMKVSELKEELEARGEGVSGNKAWLRWRLHPSIHPHARR
jgi:hypothetical protein